MARYTAGTLPALPSAHFFLYPMYMRIAILGFGTEGKSLANYFLGKGHVVTVCDKKDKTEELKNFQGLHAKFGRNYLTGLQEFDVIFRSPGIPYLKHELDYIRESMSSLTRYFFDKCPCPIVGVTGTKGKGTVSSLIYEMLKSAALSGNRAGKVFIGGNIGNSPLTFLDDLKAEDIVVLELSSFQLQDLESSPHVAVCLGISPDHLDHHKDFEEYLDAKKNIVRFQKAGDFAILDADDPNALSFRDDANQNGAKKKSAKPKTFYFSNTKSVSRGGFVKVESLLIKKGKTGTLIGREKETNLIGGHNIKNILAAATAASVLEVPVEDISRVIREFKGLPHRLEFVREIGGLKFYNDSASTNPQTAIAALRSFNGPLILIAGGSDKNADYAALGQEIVERENVKTVVLMGETKNKIEKAVEEAAQKRSRAKNPIELINAESFQEAFMVSKIIAQPGDTVLLSPASASFDMFSDYKERGEIFRNFVMDITG